MIPTIMPFQCHIDSFSGCASPCASLNAASYLLPKKREKRVGHHGEFLRIQQPLCKSSCFSSHMHSVVMSFQVRGTREIFFAPSASHLHGMHVVTCESSNLTAPFTLHLQRCGQDGGCGV